MTRITLAPDVHVDTTADALLFSRPPDVAVVDRLPDVSAAVRAAHQLRGPCDRLDVEAALGGALVDDLLQAGLLLAGTSDADLVAHARWRRIGADPAAASEAKARGVVVPDPAPEPLLRALRADLDDWNLPLRDDAPRAVILATDLLDEGIAQAVHKHADAPLLVVAAGGGTVWAFPLDPHVGPCYECLATRLRYNRPADALLTPRRWKFEGAPDASLVSEAAALITAWTAGLLPPESLVEVRGGDGVPASRTSHPVQQLPHCPHCGTPPPSGPLRLQPAPALEDGRAADSSEVARLLDPLADTTTGLVRASRTGRSQFGAHTSAFRHRLGPPPQTVDDLKRDEGHVSGGRGESERDARTGGLGEVAERVGGLWHEAVSTILARRSDFGAEAIPIEDVDLFSSSQRANRRTWNASAPDMLKVPAPLPADLPVRWVKAWSVLRPGESRYIAAGSVFYHYPYEAEPYGLVHSNGCAAGGGLEDAVLGGIRECIERDAASIFWYNQIARPALSRGLVRDLGLAQLADTLARAGRTFKLFPITTDVGVPVFVAVSRRAGGRPGWALGFGCDLDVAAAARGAAREMVQMVELVEAGAGTGPLAWTETARPEDQPQLEGLGEIRALEAGPGRSGDVRDDVRTCAERLESVGVHTWVVRQGHPVVPVPVVRVVTPGLPFIWRRLGGRRLYDVPVRLGWRTQPRAEHEMNPVSLTV